MTSTTENQKLLVLIGSPRRNGNSSELADAVRWGAEKAGATVALRFIDDYISSFLRDCRICRRSLTENVQSLTTFVHCLSTTICPLTESCSAPRFIGTVCPPKRNHSLTARFVTMRLPIPIRRRSSGACPANASDLCYLPRRRTRELRSESFISFRNFPDTLTPSSSASSAGSEIAVEK